MCPQVCGHWVFVCIQTMFTLKLLHCVEVLIRKKTNSISIGHIIFSHVHTYPLHPGKDKGIPSECPWFAIHDEAGRVMDVANQWHGDGIPVSLPECSDWLFFSHAFIFNK